MDVFTGLIKDEKIATETYREMAKLYPQFAEHLTEMSRDEAKHRDYLVEMQNAQKKNQTCKCKMVGVNQ